MRKTIATAVFLIATAFVPSTASAYSPGVWTENIYRNRIIMKESTGNPWAVNPSSGTLGLYQCHPAYHVCPYLGDIAGQHAWAQRYMAQRYGTWYVAYVHHINNGWW